MPSERSQGYLIAIDGPAGVGKSTVSVRLARTLKGRLLNTGLMYRAVAYHALKRGIVSEAGFTKIARDLKFKADKSNVSLLVNGKDIAASLRSERVGKQASYVSQFSGVRRALTAKQRKLGREWRRRFPVVVEGRDIGSVVFPNVRFKFFITASARERARRRFKQLKAAGDKITFAEVLRAQRDRDKKDSTRELAPLKRARDAIIVNTSAMDETGVVEFLKSHILGSLEG